MTNLPESRRRAIKRTVAILVIIVMAIFVYTLMRGVK